MNDAVESKKEIVGIRRFYTNHIQQIRNQSKKYYIP